MILDRILLYGAGSLLIITTGLGTVAYLGKQSALGERDVTTAAAENICTRAGSYYKSYSPSTGKPLARVKWGDDCLLTVTAIRKRADGAAAQALKAVADYVSSEDKKHTADIVAASRNDTKSHVTRKKLEVAHVAAQKQGFYGPGWFDALSDAFGLSNGHAPGSVQPAAGDAPRDRLEVPTLVGSADLRGPASPVLEHVEGHDGRGDGQ